MINNNMGVVGPDGEFIVPRNPPRRRPTIIVDDLDDVSG